jgi:hypothetical protein
MDSSDQDAPPALISSSSGEDSDCVPPSRSDSSGSEGDAGTSDARHPESGRAVRRDVQGGVEYRDRCWAMEHVRGGDGAGGGSDFPQGFQPPQGPVWSSQ